MLRTEPKVSAKGFNPDLLLLHFIDFCSATATLTLRADHTKGFRSMSLPPGFDLDAIHIAKLGQTSTLQIEIHFR